MKRAAADALILTATSIADVQAATRWCEEEVNRIPQPKLSPEDLKQFLLRKWLAQRAVSAEEGGDEVLEASYEDAKGQTKEKKTKDVFVEQSLWAWSKLGVDINAPGRDVQAKLDRSRQLPAVAIAGVMNGTVVPIEKIAAPERFMVQLRSAVGMPLSMGRGEDIPGAIKAHAFDMTTQIWLKPDGAESVVLDHMEHELTPKDGYDADADVTLETDPAGGYIKARRWSTSPD